MLRVIYPLVFVLFLLFLASKLMAFHNTSGVNINACIGYLMAIPATICLGRLSPRVRWDQMLGLLSFPLFLVHTPARNFCEKYLPHLHAAEWLGLALLASSLLVVIVEKPFDYLRYRARAWSLPRQRGATPSIESPAKNR